ncbi:MAG: ribonuclease HII [Euryarchaeota archaeon]|nr:ribonuclease HII [Euryarchaeota archaeon]
MWKIGADEAGRGPVIGPLVVCAVAMPIDEHDNLIENGVKDSKFLSSKKRQELLDWFMTNSENKPWYHSIIVCPPERIDSSSGNQGLNVLETELFAEAINAFPDDIKKSVIILNDACDVKPQRFSDRIANQLISWPWPKSSISSEHKADENDPFVGMASILAKEKRDECIKEISEQLGFSVGSGYPSDPNTKKIIPELLRDTPHPQLRWSWATVEREWNKIHDNELPKRNFAPKNQTTLF